MRFPEHHEAFVARLAQFGHAGAGPAIQKDRRSALQYLGVSALDVRKVARFRLTFSSLPEAGILAVWDDLWRHSPYGEVLFAAIEYYVPRVRKRVSLDLWPVVMQWSERAENWAHADALAGLYSRLLEAYPGDVYPQMEAWNASQSEWLRRLSLVSLIHYSGKNAVFLPLDRVLPLVSNCLSDGRYYVQKAVGWVLREMGHAYPLEVRSYIEDNMAALSATAFARAIERRPPAERDELRLLRKAQ